MKYLIIGLGIYGSNLAIDLTNNGAEVIGVDKRSSKVEAVKDFISTVYIVDASEESALSLLPIKSVDLVIVAIGEDFGASIKVVALLKKMGVKHIYARAGDDLHLSILKNFDIDRILTPEQRAARDLTNEMSLGGTVASLAITEDSYVLKFEAPEELIGMKYSSLNLATEYGINLICVTRPTQQTDILGLSHIAPTVIDVSTATVEAKDILTCFGSKRAFKKFYRLLK